MRIYHVSDLHFGDSVNSNKDANRLLDLVEKDFDAGGQKLLVVTGDVTANGEEKEYHQAVLGLERFRGHLLVVPGNHDYNWGGNKYEPERARRFDNSLLKELGIAHAYFYREPEVRTFEDGEEKVLVVGLNSNAMDTDLGGWDAAATGWVTSGQRTKLSEILNDGKYSDHWKVVCLHHQVKKGGDPIDLLHDADKVLDVVRRRVQVLAFGHTCGGPIPNYPPDPGDLAYTPASPDGRPHLLNANLSVLWRQYFRVTFPGAYAEGKQPFVELKRG
ncbi:MAG: metallophosphoesterase [Polyangiaceae bacterium]|nr:metallophosphoesterase [Polyangiaceae bacterium]